MFAVGARRMDLISGGVRWKGVVGREADGVGGALNARGVRCRRWSKSAGVGEVGVGRVRRAGRVGGVYQRLPAAHDGARGGRVGHGRRWQIGRAHV